MKRGVRSANLRRASTSAMAACLSRLTRATVTPLTLERAVSTIPTQLLHVIP
jgi:hypothetical protein